MNEDSCFLDKVYLLEGSCAHLYTTKTLIDKAYWRKGMEGRLQAGTTKTENQKKKKRF
jgi:hypothetical protein